MNAQKFITEANIHRVCQLLGWDIETYTNYQHEKGLEYLAEQADNRNWDVDIMAKTPRFWDWWINHWNARDAEFIGTWNDWPMSWLRRKYNDLNAVEGFSFWPHKIIMEQSYAIMIEQINKEAVKA